MKCADIERVVRDVLEDIGVPNAATVDSQVLLGEILDPDDFTFWFVPVVERAIGVKPPVSEWSNVYTLQDAVTVFIRAMGYEGTTECEPFDQQVH